MARKRCNSCRGEYESPGRDGLLYFHSCAPTRVRALRIGEVVAPDDPAAVLNDLGIVTGVRVAIAEPRDERPAGDKAPDPHAPMSAGAGATAL